MYNHKEKAKELFFQGCNCSQAVFAAFCDVTDIDKETALKMSAPFGGGIGRLRETCGAVSGMCLAAGCLFGYSDLENPKAKQAHYAFIASMVNKFREKQGSITCKEILGLKNYEYSPVAQPRTPEFYEKRPCLKCIMTATEILDEEVNLINNE